MADLTRVLGCLERDIFSSEMSSIGVEMKPEMRNVSLRLLSDVMGRQRSARCSAKCSANSAKAIHVESEVVESGALSWIWIGAAKQSAGLVSAMLHAYQTSTPKDISLPVTSRSLINNCQSLGKVPRCFCCVSSPSVVITCLFVGPEALSMAIALTLLLRGSTRWVMPFATSLAVFLGVCWA